MVGGGPAHQGVGATFDAQTVTKSWSDPLPDSPYTSPILSNDALFVCYGNGLQSMDPADGDLLWKKQVSQNPGGTPAVADGMLVTTWDSRTKSDASSATVRCFDSQSGDKQWNRSLDDRAVFATTISDRTAYIRGASTLYAVDIQDGSIRWKVGDLPKFNQLYYDISKDITPAVANSTVYTPNPNGVTAIDTETQKNQWTKRVTKVRSAPTVKDGQVFVAGAKSGVLALDAATGHTQWSWPNGSWTSPAIANGTAYTTTGFDAVALDAKDGSRVWHTGGNGLQGDIYSSPVVSGDSVILGSITEDAACIDTSANSGGRFNWRYDHHGTKYTPAVSANGVYQVDGGGNLVALS